MSYDPQPGGALTVSESGVTAGAAPQIDFIEGAGIQIDLDAISTPGRVKITLTATGGGGGGAGAGEPFVTIGNTAGLSAERALAVGARLSLTDGGANSTVTLDIPVNAITNARLAQMAARTLKANATNALADPQDLAGGGAGTVVQDTGSALVVTALTRILQNLSLEGDITPAQITADQNNYNPANLGTAAVVRSSTDAARSITGLVPGTADGDLKLWINVGSFDETLVSESASSTATNRFTGGDLTLRSGECALLYHDPTTDRWRTVLRSHRPLAGNSTITVTGDSIVVATGGITGNEIAAAIKDPAAGTAGLRTLSTTGTTACAGNDSRLSDSRAPNGAASGDLTGTYPGPTLAANAVTDAKLRQSGALAVVGRSANSTGNVADIQATAATDAVLRESGSTLGFGTIATGGIAANAVTDAKLRQGVARSVIGVTGNATANVADIQGTTDQVLRVNGAGTALAFGTVAAGGIASDAVTTAKILDANVTDAKLANMGALAVKGRSANSSGVSADIAASAASGAVLRESGSTIGFGTLATAALGANIVTGAKFRQGAALSVVGVTGNATADVADIAAGTDGDILRRKGTALAFGRALPKVVTLTDAATIAVDLSLLGIGDSAKVTLGGNRTVGVPTNPTDGQWFCLAVFQDGTGSRTIAFTTGAGGFRATELSLTQTLSTAAGKVDYFLFRYNSTDDRLDLMDFRKAA